MVAVGGGAALLSRRFRDHRVARQHDRAELEQVRKLADEDVTLLGEELQRLDAEVAGRPLPELRVPCFFNPQHGPSVADVAFTPRGRGTRRVPACARDAARIRDREEPEVRQVRIGSRPVPYYEAWAVLAP